MYLILQKGCVIYGEKEIGGFAACSISRDGGA